VPVLSQTIVFGSLIDLIDTTAGNWNRQIVDWVTTFITMGHMKHNIEMAEMKWGYLRCSENRKDMFISLE
jgi:hypothetical protein